MARQNTCDRSSTLTTIPPAPPPHQRRHRTRRTRLTPGPSSSWVAFFATVAATALPAESHPLAAQAPPPPEFLCPHLGITSCLSVSPTPASSAHPQISSTITARPVSFTQQVPRSASIADKYVQGDDKRWRKTNIWSLYGSTVCLTSGCPVEPTSTVDYATLAAESAYTTFPPSTSATPSASSSASPSLPSGWPTQPKNDNVTTPVIITLSLVLAFSICAIIILCVVFRRKRRSRAEKDLEKKERGNADEDSDEEPQEMKRVRSQQRIWAKATARWKANIRQSARRRRKHAATGSKEPGSRSLAETCQSSQSSVSLPHSADTHGSAAYETSSTTSYSPRSHDCVNARVTQLPNPTSSSTQPPAYMSKSPAARDAFAHPHLSENTCPYPDPDDTTPSCSNSRNPHIGGAYQGSVSAAHVATDDKAVLARIASMASAPPLPDPSLPEEVTTTFASVPALDDAFQDFSFDVHIFDTDSGESRSQRAVPRTLPHEHLQVPTYSRDPSLQPSLLPPPPLKTHMAAPAFYDYPASFEEDYGVQPETHPSAPPFEENYGVEPETHPSAPPFEVEGFAVPSAPPLHLEFEAADVGDPLPSAPLNDGELTVGTSGSGTVPCKPADRCAESSPSASAIRLVPSSWNASPPRYLP